MLDGQYDNCGEQTVDWYTRASPMRAALNKTGRPILFMNEPMYLPPMSGPLINSGMLLSCTALVADAHIVLIGAGMIIQLRMSGG